MKRYYRNRIILSAMLSFFLLFVMAVIGIWLFSYQQMERETNEFMAAMQHVGKDGSPGVQPAPPPMFGYQPDLRRYPSGFYDILLGSDHAVQYIQRFGIMEEAEIDVTAYVQRAVNGKSPTGTIGSFKYSLTYDDDGTGRLILLDISIQLLALFNVLKSALIVGVLLMALLFLILLPVSSRLADAFVRNNEKQKQFITDAGHDLKTPVAIIRANLDVLELQGKTKWSENIRNQIERMERLVSQLVMMARLEETGDKGKTAGLDFSAIVQEQWKAYAPVFAQKNLHTHADVKDGLHLNGQEASLGQMVSLLLDNVFRYANEEGDVSIALTSEKNKIKLTLSNSVDHLPTQAPSVLAERFTRGDTARSQKSGGLGIGLAAIKRIVEIHRGRLDIQYQGENRFCVTVTLPGT